MKYTMTFNMLDDKDAARFRIADNSLLVAGYAKEFLKEIKNIVENDLLDFSEAIDSFEVIMAETFEALEWYERFK